MKPWGFVCLFCHVASALLEEHFVSFEQSRGAFEIQGSTIFIDKSDPVGIRKAAESLARDLQEVTGSQSAVAVWPGNGTWELDDIKSPSAIVIASVGSALVQGLQDRHSLDFSHLGGKWESFKTTTIAGILPGFKNGLLLVGSDKRGTMYAAYTLAEQSGQSPLHWWADIPAKKHERIFALSKETTHGEPSVKYRGIFINDEAPGLVGWWASKVNNTDYTLDSKFYEHVFDLLLRLKANFLWPAMWASFVPRPGRVFFTDDLRNQQLADDYGIVISTSHHEPMQRATNEWDSELDGEWSWVTNKKKVAAFMEEGVRRAGQNESYFTLGMRGPNDDPMDAEDPVATLEDVFDTQRNMLSEIHGKDSQANQVWTIYKEVHTYYAAGLSPPDDVTLMFTDDNWGNVQRLPTEDERKRSGGIGLYYHFQYVGRPKSYKWHNTNNIPKVYKELSQAYERGADRIWVMNVGDIKPMEIPLSFSMDLAWNTSGFDFESIPNYVEALAGRDFGVEYAEDIASALMKHSHLVGKRKYELTLPTTYSLLNFHEAENALKDWAELAEEVLDMQDRVPGPLRDGLYHLLVYPVLAGYEYHNTVIGLAQNYQFAVERRNSANYMAQKVLDSFERDYDLVDRYDQLADGKWAGIMSTPKFDTGVERWHPPARDVLTNLSYVQLRQDYDYGFGNLGIYAEGSTSAARQGRICGACDPALPTSGSYAPRLPLLEPYGPQTRSFDLFHRGNHNKPLRWAATPPLSWVKLSSYAGTLTKEQPDKRVSVSVDWLEAPENFDEHVRLRIEWDDYFDLVYLPLRSMRAPKEFIGFPEASNYISIEAPHFQRSSEQDISFRHVKYLGSRSESGSIALRPYVASFENSSAAKEAWVEYDIFVFNASSNATATVYVNSALDTNPDLAMEYSLGLESPDQGAKFQRLLSQPDIPGDTPTEWTESVADHVWTRDIPVGKLKAGKHTLRWRANSPEVYLEKIVVWLHGPPLQTYLGPPETSFGESKQS